MVCKNKAEIIGVLQSDILRLQGFKPQNGTAVKLGLGPLINAFPNAVFPVGAVHEFLSDNSDLSATRGFVSGLLSSLANASGVVMWICLEQTLFPPALASFGVQPDRVIFVNLRSEKDILWAMEEALKCSALTAVVCELRELNFTASRRLQLAVEYSQVTGFVLLLNPSKVKTTACVSRWKIETLPGIPVNDLPGIGFPRWKVELLKIKNGKPGAWNVSWVNGRFEFPSYQPALAEESAHKTVPGNLSTGLPLEKTG